MKQCFCTAGYAVTQGYNSTAQQLCQPCAAGTYQPQAVQWKEIAYNLPEYINLARQCAAGGCTVTGISQYTGEGFLFSKLVDGDTSSSNPGAHTNTANNDWMMIDLGQTRAVDYVRVYVPLTSGNDDLTKYAEYQAQLKTGVGGWRIVRFLPPNLGRWYQGNYITTSTFTIPTIGTPYDYTNEWAVPFGKFDEMFFATFDMTYWLQCLKTSVLGDYGNAERPVIKSSAKNYAHSVKWFNRAVTQFNQEDPWISINDHITATPLMLYGENSVSTHHQSLLNAYGGMCVLVRDSTTIRLNNFQIRIGDSSTFGNNPACVTGAVTFENVKNFSCVLTGRYVSIQQFNTENMNLRELEVYGSRTSNTINYARQCSGGGCPVTVSSVLHPDNAASKSVNGNTQDAFISSGPPETNPYLIIDLQQIVSVTMALRSIKKSSSGSAIYSRSTHMDR